MRYVALVMVLACAACGEDVSPEQQDMLDDQAIAAVEEANSAMPPLNTIVPDPILYPDIEANDIYGISCAYAPGTSLGARVIAREADAFMKIEGEIVRFAADPGARELPFSTRSLYNGREFSLRLDINGDGTSSGEEVTEYEGTMTVRDRWGRVVYTGTGLAQCGS